MNQAPSPRSALTGLITGHYISQAIYVAAKLGIADQLQDGAKGSEELAKSTKTHAPTLYRLLRALAGVGVFDEDDGGRFSLTPLSEYLVSDVADSARAFAITMNEPWFRRAWEGLPYSVETGQSAFDQVHGIGFWEYLTRDPAAGALFAAAMTGGASERAKLLLRTCDWQGVRTLVDVGGGEGQLLAVVLASHPEMRGLLFDRPEVVTGASAVLQEARVADRCQVVTGDFFERVPEDGDAYVMSQILHDWDDDPAVTILQNCRRAMRQGARLLLIELVLAPRGRADRAAMGDLNMLVLLGGRERTAAEFDTLLQAAGFRLERHTQASPRWSIIEGIAA
jgi:hypothetical protein